jgi:hypothetical protein
VIPRIGLTLGVCVIALWSLCNSAVAESRLALVIGNSAYRTVSPLPNPVNDAKAMADFLTKAGFDVTPASDLTQADMRATVGTFAAKIARAGSDTIALVYYAGHGVQIDGENFLVPVDVRIERESEVPLQAFRLADLMNTLSSVPSRMRIVMLDACRNNPFSQINKTAGRGLAIVDAPAGSIVSYSTSPGAEAEDGSGDNSPYTSALLRVAAEPGLPIEQAFKRTRLSVNQATSGRQTPWESSSLSTDFAFIPGAGGSASPPAKSATTPAAASAAQPAVAGKSVEIWRRDLRGKTAEQAYDIVILDDSAEAYEAYVSLFATPPFGPRVRGMLDRRKEMIAWYIAVTINSPASFEAFLAQYKSSDFAPTAMRLLERTHSRSLMAGAVPTQLASANLSAPTCACSPSAPAKKGSRRASAAPPPPVVYYPPPPPAVRVVPVRPPYVRPPYIPPRATYPPPRGTYPPPPRKPYPPQRVTYPTNIR